MSNRVGFFHSDSDLLGLSDENPFRFSFPQMPPFVDDSKEEPFQPEIVVSSSSNPVVAIDLTRAQSMPNGPLGKREAKRMRVRNLAQTKENWATREISAQERLSSLQQQVGQFGTLGGRINEIFQSIQVQMAAMQDMAVGLARQASMSSELAYVAKLKTIEQLAESMVKDGNYSKAIALLDTVAKQKGTAGIAFWKSLAYGKMGELQKSYRLALKALNLDPLHLPARFHLVSLLFESARTKKAQGNRVDGDKFMREAFAELETYAQLTTRSTGMEILDPNCAGLKIEMYLEVGLREAAEEEFRRLEGQYPTSRRLGMLRGKFFL